MPQLYTKFRNGAPIEYRYGDEWVSMYLLMEGGYKTPEEAIAAWEQEQNRESESEFNDKR